MMASQKAVAFKLSADNSRWVNLDVVEECICLVFCTVKEGTSEVHYLVALEEAKEA